MLQFNAFKNTVVDKPTIAPVAVAKTNHFRMLKKITDCSVSLRLIPKFYPRSAAKGRKNSFPLRWFGKKVLVLERNPNKNY